ncbi:MAG: FecR domain-containing protein [Chitinophagaceae bacterium]|nr:FecR domain-containing protein [Chitinophagaceae bacterium]
MTTSRIEYLVQQSLSGKASPDEWKEFQELAMKQEQTPELERALEASWQQFQPSEMVPEGQLNDIYAELIGRKAEEPPVRILHWRRWAWAAASILLISAACVYYFNRSKPEVQIANNSPVPLPGKDGAILTLGDGSSIVLDSLNNGVVSTQNGTEIRLDNRQLIYQGGPNQSFDVTYNTLSTPRGRQFSITLPDGTRAWLNAASSLRFPTHFTGPERQVQVTGEAYLEVAQDQKSPFIVQANGISVKVLGTSFNINAYADEAGIGTTLVEGRVQITKGMETKTLKPGQQLLIDYKNGSATIQKVDIDQVIAWKNGYFNFEGVGIQTLMRQLERWYDIEVVYPQGIPSIEFVGKMSRNIPLPDLLEGLKGAGVNFRIENNHQLTVLP